MVSDAPDEHGFHVGKDRESGRLVHLEFLGLPEPGAPGAADPGPPLPARIADILALAPHPTLALPHGVFRTAGRFCLVSEPVEGTRLSTQQLPVAVALDQLDQIAQALEQLHGSEPGLAHGALSPDRIVVAPDRRVLVTGAATAAARLRRWPPPADVMPFIAPEVLAGSEPTPAGDIYSLAALAMQLLTGASPAAAADHGLSSSPRVSALITHVLQAGLAHDPVLRPLSAADFVRRLRTRLTGALPVGTVTFLLTDVCDSTSLWDQAPPSMAVAIERYEQLCAETVDRFGGFHPRDQGEGDSVFVVFPRAPDAVACAVELQRKLAREEWPADASLTVRIALHSGEARVRKGNYRGIAVNTCARLRSLAHGGQTLISLATAEMVHDSLPDAVNLRDAGLRRLRGLDRPIRVFQLVGDGLPDDLPSPAGTAGIPAPDLIGRDGALASAIEALDTAVDGTSRTVLLSGPGGVGKTHLAVRLAEHAGLQDVAVHWGRCAERQGAPAYWPWLQVVREMVDQCPDDVLRAALGSGASDVVAFFPALRDRLCEVPVAPQVSAEAARFRLFDSLTSFIRRLSERQPLLIVLEDVHTADKPSMLLLDFLSEYLQNARVLILVTYHGRGPSFTSEDRHGIGGLLRLRSSVPIALRDLTRSQVARYIEADLGVELAPDVVDAVFEASGGNPFYLKEIVWLLAEEGRLTTPRPLTEMRAPQGVREVILRRVALLPPQAARVLKMATVIGRTGPLDVLGHVAGDDSQVLLDALDQLAAADFLDLEFGAVPRFVFSHFVVRQALYETMNQAERVRLHLVIAEAIESRGHPDSRLSEIVHHLLAAAPLGASGKTLDYARRAGREAVERFAYEEGAQLFRAARLAPRLDGRLGAADRCDLLLAEGKALCKAGELAEARDVLRQAADLARELGDGSRMAAAGLTAGQLCVEMAQVDDMTVAILRDALVLLEPGKEADTPLRAQLLAQLAMELSYEDKGTTGNEVRGSLTHSRHAVELARQCGDRRSLAFSLLSYRYALAAPTHVERRLAAVTESIALAESVGDCELSMRGRTLRSIDLLEKGDIGAARAEMATFTRDALRQGQPFHTNCGVVMRALQALMAGDLVQAEADLDQVFDTSRRLQRHTALQAAYVQLFFLRREQGRLDELVTRFAELEQDGRIPGWQAILALAQLELGFPEGAKDSLDLLLRDGIPVAMDSTWLATVCVAAEAAVGVGDRAMCARLFAVLKPYSGLHAVVGVMTPVVCLGSVARHLGLLCARLGRLDEAEAYLQQAAAANRAMGNIVVTAHCRHDRAAVLLRRNGPGDAATAQRLLAAAASFADRCGLEVLKKRVGLLRGSHRIERRKTPVHVG